MKTKKYILTGGPGSGKSSLIKALEIQGEYVIRESAEDYIKYRQANGQKEPWIEPDFQQKILELQIIREQKIPNHAKRVFLDRGSLDGLAYLDYKHPTTQNIETMVKNAQYEPIVFLIKKLDFHKKDSYRRENEIEALELANNLEKIYQNHGYKTIKIESGTINERLEQIYKELRFLNNQ